MENKKKGKRILLTGGGTAGSVTPLLALAEDLVSSHGFNGVDFLWIGTNEGPEREMVEGSGIEFRVIQSGKLRRYFSLKNFFDIFKIILGFFESFSLVVDFKPNLVITAGSYVSVPVVFAAWLKKIPVMIHQQDACPGLANKLMAPFAKIITVTFEKSLLDYGKKALCVGNPIRKEFQSNKIDKRTAIQKLGLRSEKPVVLIMGGGTGALAINNLVRESLSELNKFCQIIHLTGRDKDFGFAQISSENINYKNFEFLNIEGMIKVFTVADVIVSRCGMASLTELCYFQAPSILIPMPDSHQEDNAEIFKQAQAAIVLSQEKISRKIFSEEIRQLVENHELQESLKNNIKDVIKTNGNRLIDIITKELAI